MKRILAAIAIAFGLFSRIPMPLVEWSRSNMRYALAAMPFVGLVQGFCAVVWGLAAAWLGLSAPLVAAGLLAIPFAVNGGIHLDGLADTADARSSHAERARKLEIMADPHIGAFGVIAVVLHLIALFAVLLSFPTHDVCALAVLPGLYGLSRCLSAFAVATWPAAKDNGIVRTMSDDAAPRVVPTVLCVFATVCAVWMVVWGRLAAVIAVVAALLVFVRYRHMAMHEFGGTSGDLAGWFLQMVELAMLTAFVIAGPLFERLALGGALL